TACGSSNNATTPTPTQASITVSVSPDPVTPVDCSPNPPCQAPDGRFYRWRVAGTMTVQETAGVAGVVNSIIDTSFNPPIMFSASDITQRSGGTNRVAARGTLAISVNLLYGLVDNPTANRQHTFLWGVQFLDDRGNQVTANAQWVAN